LALGWIAFGETFKPVQTPEPNRRLLGSKLVYCLSVQISNAALGGIFLCYGCNSFLMDLATRSQYKRSGTGCAGANC
jgi:hypothetical protein